MTVLQEQRFPVTAISGSVADGSSLQITGKPSNTLLLAAWQYSDEMMAWREQRTVELRRVDAIMHRDESQKRLSLAGMADEQVLEWEKYAQALRDGPESVTEVGELPRWPEAPAV